MMKIIQKILFVLMSVLFPELIYAFDWVEDGRYPGRYPDIPIVHNIPSGDFEICDTTDTYMWSLHKFQPETIYYDITLSEPKQMTICTYGSEVRNISVRVSYIDAAGDTIPLESDPTFKELYVDQLHAAQAWNHIDCHGTQDFFISIYAPAGKYRVEVEGIYTQSSGTANGKICTTFVGSDIKPRPSLPIPRKMLLGTLQRPFFIRDMPCDQRYGLWTTTEITDFFINTREGFDGRVYYEFTVGGDAELMVKSKASSTEVFIYKKDDVYDSFKCKAESTEIRRISQGDYIVEARDSLRTLSPTTICFCLESAPPPWWERYIIYDENVAGRNSVTQRTYTSADHTGYMESVGYFDGLGRQTHIVNTDASPWGGDLVSLTMYDTSGREWKKFLPGLSSGGYVRYDEVDYATVYQEERRPFAETLYDGTPLMRPSTEYGAGVRWYGDESAVTHSYAVNGSSGRPVRCYSVTDTPDSPNCVPSVTSDGCYAQGELTVHTCKNEDGHKVSDYTDSRGYKILSRVDMEDGSYADTYYVYDTYDNLTAVLTPEASELMSNNGSWTYVPGEPLYEYCYLYSYDIRSRIAAKWQPGGVKTSYLYDSTDRQVAWQDGNLKALGKWHFTVADAFGRECISGLCSSIALKQISGAVVPVRADRMADVQPDSSPETYGYDFIMHGYGVFGVTMTDIEVHSVKYYDNYGFLEQCSEVERLMLSFMPTTVCPAHYPDAKGHLTGTITALPTGAASDSIAYIYTATYYDAYDRTVLLLSTNHLGGLDRVSTSYDFSGNPVITERYHSAPAYGAEPITMRWERSYDSQGRELTVTHRLNTAASPTVLSANGYDAIGRLASRTRSEDSGVQETFTYDVRSRLESISSLYYRQSLAYTYGGKVGKMTWWSYSPYGQNRTYDYGYDAMSRLTRASYTDDSGMNGIYDTTYDYDLNGNVVALTRSGLYSNNGYDKKHMLIDDLTMNYRGNRLISVSDGCAGPFYQGAWHFVDGADEEEEYTYDASGNIDSDLNRGILSTVYDVNNQPRAISFSDGSTTKYLYDTRGTKLRTVHSVASLPPVVPGVVNPYAEFLSSVTDYCGGIVYEDSLISRINLDDGYISYLGYGGNRLSSPQYHFYVRDHLGNNRVDVCDGAVWQAMDYYPFGLPMASSYLSAKQRWLFGNKEMDRINGLDLYDQEARQYDPALCRFRSIDSYAEKYYPLSSYLYCAANPLAYTDPTGMEVNTDRLTSAQLQIYNFTLETISNSQLFSTMYQELMDSDKVFYINFVSTEAEDNIDTGGNLRLLKDGNFQVNYNVKTGTSEISCAAFSEELFHGSQQLTSYQSKEFNYEFEAKIFVRLVQMEAGFGFTDLQISNNEFDSVINNAEGEGLVREIDSGGFLDNYNQAAAKFVKRHIDYGTANKGYTKPSKVFPEGLRKVIYNTYR